MVACRRSQQRSFPTYSEPVTTVTHKFSAKFLKLAREKRCAKACADLSQHAQYSRHVVRLTARRKHISVHIQNMHISKGGTHCTHHFLLDVKGPLFKRPPFVLAVDISSPWLASFAACLLVWLPVFAFTPTCLAASVCNCCRQDSYHIARHTCNG